MRKKALLPVLLIISILLSCRESPKPGAGEKQEAMTAEEKEVYLKKGREIALVTFATLSTELGNALKEGGVSKAVEVCNIAAMPLVDSLSKAHNADIRRTSLKVRNPKNAASETEKEMLMRFEAAQKAGNAPQPEVVEVDGMVAFYAPIVAQPLCLSCHGKPGETVNSDDYSYIKSLYPDDQAIGYSANDLRGMWAIKFEK